MAADPLARALAHLSRVGDATAAEVHEVAPLGHVLSTPELPGVRAVNCLRLEGPHTGVTVTDLTALIEARLPHALLPELLVQDEATGRRLEPALRADGWAVERDLVMALEGEPDRSSDGRGVRETGPDDEDGIDALYAAWSAEEEDVPEPTDEALAYARRERAATSGRLHVVDGDDGRPAAMAQLRLADDLAQLEDVFARPDERGRGHARALVGHLAARAREEDADLVFLFADDDGTAKELYARLGFAAVGAFYSAYRRRPPA